MSKKYFVSLIAFFALLFVAKQNMQSQVPDCGVSATLQFIQPNEQDSCCTYRLVVQNARKDLYKVSVLISGGSFTSVQPVLPVTTTYWGPTGADFISGIYPVDSTFPVATLCIRAAGIFTLTIYFSNANNQYICQQILQNEQCRFNPPSNSCITKTLNLSTGYDPTTGTVLPPSSPPGTISDPYWVVIQDPLPFTSEPRPASTINKHSAWGGPLSGSQWVAVYNSYSNDTNGLYVYQRCFCVEGQARGRLVLDVLADDSVGVYFNGGYIKGPGSYVTPLHIDTILPLNQGKNCLRMQVGNLGSVAHGLDVSGSITLLSGPTNASLLVDSCCDNRGWIIGQKFHDLNCNGKLDPNEPSLQGWIICATSGSMTYCDTTGSDGWYNIPVPAGTYSLTEVVQPGFTPSSGGPYIVQVSPGKVEQRDFLNCTAPPPCDKIGEVKLDSGCCTFAVPIFPVGPITSINWNVSGGYMENIFSISCPGMTLSPANPYNTTSGTINFSPACSASPLLLNFEVSPTTSSGVVTLILTINHPGGKVCRDTLRLECARAPLVKCDSLAVSPFVFAGLQLSGRQFKIFNQKVPTAPICSVKIQLVPDPDPGSSTLKWNGGSLIIDGIGRSWGVSNSGTPYYSLINCSGPSAPQGNPAVSTIQFNLGVDYTLNWTGDVILTIIHCDGDTCQLVYKNWCAKKSWKQCLIVFPFPIDINPVSITGKLLAGNWTIRDDSNKVAFATVSLPPNLIEDERVKLVSSQALVEGQNSEPIMDERGTRPIAQRMTIKTKSARVTEIPLWVFLSVPDNFDTTKAEVIITLYDSESNPIRMDTVKAGTQVSGIDFNSQGNENVGLSIIPNPSADEITLNFSLNKPGPVTIELVNNLGQVIGTWVENYEFSGRQELGISTSKLAQGTYQVRLLLPDGRFLSQPFIISR